MSKKNTIYLSKKELSDIVEPYDLKDVLKSLKRNKLIDSFLVLKFIVEVEVKDKKKLEISSFFSGYCEDILPVKSKKKLPS